MKTNKLATAILVIILLSNCKVTQTENQIESIYLENTKENCFDQCLIQDQIGYISKDYAIYTGNEKLENVPLENNMLITQLAKTRWVKEQAKNPDSSIIQDSFYWCLKELPELVRSIQILKDTSASKNYKIESIQEEVLVEKGGYFKSLKVLCPENYSQKLFHHIQNRLRKLNYYKGENEYAYGIKTSRALIEYQKTNDLPVGKLDVETLETLDIIID